MCDTDHSEMQQFELIVLPTPALGHLPSIIGLAKLLLNRDRRLSVTVLIIPEPVNLGSKSFVQSLFASEEDDDVSSRIKFVQIPLDNAALELMKGNPANFVSFIDGHKPFVRDAVATVVSSNSSRLAAFILDMCCSSMIEVADEFGVPSYVYFTGSATFLGLIFHLQTLLDEFSGEFTGYEESDALLHIPTYVNPVPIKVLPSFVLEKSTALVFIQLAEKFRKMKGLIANTFLEMESHAIQKLSDGIAPPMYPVGPVIGEGHGGGVNGDGEHRKQQFDIIMKWLEIQPPSSVVFLCFGSLGTLPECQVKEIAHALEQSVHRFLWSLRRPREKVKFELAEEFQDSDQILPEGFLENTINRGKVTGWVPQVEVLSHPAIGGFVSHCGWNSTLESIWSGVPMVTWPLYAEQQINAFQIVKELGTGIEMKMDYKWDFFGENKMVLTADVIANVISKVMNMGEEDVKEMKGKVKEMKEKSRAAMAEGGSSYAALGRLIKDIIPEVS